MATVLERLQKLMALCESPNENEARNAAVLAIALIRKHALIITVPEKMPSSGRHRAVAEASPAPASTRKKTPASKRTKRVGDPVEKITSPLGGECVFCGDRYRAQAQVYWFASGGGMHPRCFEDWAKKQER